MPKKILGNRVPKTPGLARAASRRMATPRRSTEKGRNGLAQWWGHPSDREKLFVWIAGGVAFVAIGGAVAWAIATEGAVVAVRGVTVYIGKAAAKAARA